MSTPPQPAPPPPAQPPPQPAPPAPPPPPSPQPPAAPPGSNPPEEQPPGPGLESAYQRERERRRELENELAALKQSAMSDAERAVATARAEGRAEAESAAARQLAAAEFKYAAAGKITDPDKALEMLDLDKLVRDGAPDLRKIRALVDQLAAVPPPPPPPGYVPAGPRQTQPNGTGGDWLRAAAAEARRR